MSLARKFNWTVIDDKQFEEIVYEIVKAKNPIQIIWRSDTGGKGRDIQATFLIQDTFGEFVQEIYFIEAKHYQSGVSPTDIMPALSWAMAEKPSVFVIATSSHLTNPCRDFIDSWKKNNPNVRVNIWERKDIESFILSKTSTRKAAVSLGILPPSINDILPENPKQARDNPLYPAIAYRYLMTEDEISQIDDFKFFLEDVKQTISGNCDKYTPFEIDMGLYNWSVFLNYLQAQIGLQLSLMNYILALENNASIEELQMLSAKVKESAEKITDDNESKPRWLLID
ncbi:restriction endonuclease [Brasilonema bromeliae]|nr:restriction endonuclease [Brasilonema bromeliae]